MLFINARSLDEMAVRSHADLSDDDITKIADTIGTWRTDASVYEDVAGSCASMKTAHIAGGSVPPGLGSLRRHLTTFDESDLLQKQVSQALERIGH